MENNNQEVVDKIFCLFAKAMRCGEEKVAEEAVIKLAENYRRLFQVENVRQILLKMAGEYRTRESMLACATDEQYGSGVADYIGRAIERYYGE